MTDAPTPREWRFELFDGSVLTIVVAEDDPGDMGEPRSLSVDDGTLLVARAALTRREPLDVERLRKSVVAAYPAAADYYHHDRPIDGFIDAIAAEYARLEAADAP